MKTVKTEIPKPLRQKKLYPVAIAYALLIVALTTYSLFKFDELVDIVIDDNFLGGRLGVAALSLAAMAGVLSLPYLLRMTVSPLMRATSFVCAGLMPFIWVIWGIWLIMQEVTSSTRALLLILAGLVGAGLLFVSLKAIGMPHPKRIKR